jgi:hypothetical protein
LPSSLEPVTSVAWDSIREEAYLSVTGEPHVLVADRKGVIRKIELGLPSSSWVGFRHDSLFVADGRSETLVILDLRSDKKEVLHWGYKMSDEHPVFYPSMILWDGTIWARARGLAEAPGPVPRMVYDREGAVRDTLGYTHRTRKWMTISDPNGRLPTEFRILDPLDPVDWVSVSANGQWASILNQTPERNGGVSVELTLEHFGVGRLKTSWTVPDALIPTEEVAALANRLGEALPPKEADLFRLWLKSKLKGEHSRPPVTGLLQGVDGVVWLRRGLGTFGTR